MELHTDARFFARRFPLQSAVRAFVRASPSRRFKPAYKTKYCVYTTNRYKRAMLFNRISLFRQEKGLTRKALAEMVSVNPQTIGYLERGDYRPTVELALKLAQSLGVSVEMVFGLEPFPSLAQQLDPRTAQEVNHGNN